MSDEYFNLGYLLIIFSILCLSLVTTTIFSAIIGILFFELSAFMITLIFGRIYSTKENK